MHIELCANVDDGSCLGPSNNSTGICNSCYMGMGDLPDMYAWIPDVCA